MTFFYEHKKRYRYRKSSYPFEIVTLFVVQPEIKTFFFQLYLQILPYNIKVMKEKGKF